MEADEKVGFKINQKLIIGEHNLNKSAITKKLDKVYQFYAGTSSIFLIILFIFAVICAKYDCIRMQDKPTDFALFNP